MKPVAYGIDFGTTNSVLAVAFEDGSVEVPKGIGASDRSLLYLNRLGNRLAGDEAVRTYVIEAGRQTRCRACSIVDWVDGQPLGDCRDAKSSGHCLDARLLSRIKAVLADDSFSGTHSWGSDFTIDELISEILRTMKRSADRHYGVDVRDVALGHPVRFEGAAGSRFDVLQKLGEDRLREAAVRAGFSGQITLAAESRAAIAHDSFDDGCVLCLDFGGGTFDVAIADVAGMRATVLALEGVAIGGEEFDSKIFDAIVAPRIGLDSAVSALTASIRRGLRSFSGISELQRNHSFISLNPSFKGEHGPLMQTLYEIIYGGQAWNLFAAISDAKHRLSDMDETTIQVRSRDFNLDVPFTRGDFEELIATDLRKINRVIDYAIEDAKISEHEITAVARTGGSSQIPAFQEMIAARFPDAVQVEMDPFGSVATGLAELAFARGI